MTIGRADLSAGRGSPPAWAMLVLLVVFAAGLGQRAQLAASTPPRVASDAAIYISMAVNMGHGLGLYNPQDVAEMARNPEGFRPRPAPSASDLRTFTQNDLGLLVVYRAAMALFGDGVSPLAAVTWLQVAVDSLNILLVFLLGWRVLNAGYGLLASVVYAGLQPYVHMVATFPYYYYWMGCFSLWNLCLLAVLTDPALEESRSPGSRALLGASYGLFSGFAVFLRSSLLGMVALSWLVLLVRWRRSLPWAAPLLGAMLLAQALTLGPLAAHAHACYGSFHPPRLVWHTVYTGIGAHPNPRGLTWGDQWGFKLAASRGLRGDDPEWTRKYEEILQAEVRDILREDPWLLWRNAVRNFANGLVIFDENRKVHLDVGPLGLRLDPMPSLPRAAVLLVFGILWYYVVLRRREGWWAFTVAWLQGLLLLAMISVVCPPFFGYNLAYVPTFILGYAMALYGGLDMLLRGAGLAWRKMHRP